MLKRNVWWGFEHASFLESIRVEEASIPILRGYIAKVTPPSSSTAVPVWQYGNHKAAFTRQTYVGKLVLGNFKKLTTLSFTHQIRVK